MRYYRSRRWSYGTNWSRYHERKHDQLRRVFGGIEKDILQIFLSLPSYALNGLLSRYGEKYGRKAEQYARKAYPDWQSNTIKPAGQTVERLVELLPQYLSENQRFDLIKKLRKHHLRRLDLSLATTPERWREELTPLINQLLEHNRTFDLPPFVYEKAAWLTRGDAASARRLLQAIDDEESRLRLSYVDAELHNIEFIVANIKNAAPVVHRLELPQGSFASLFAAKRKRRDKKLPRSWLESRIWTLKTTNFCRQ